MREVTVADCEHSLRVLLELCEIKVGSSEVGPVEVDPTELLDRQPPERWISSAALHMADLSSHCATIQSHVRDMAVIINDPSPDQNNWMDILFEMLYYVGMDDDMRFHCSLFPVYGELIRQIILDKFDDVPEAYNQLHPNATEKPAQSVVSITDYVRERSSLNEEELQRAVADIGDFAEASELVFMSIGCFVSDCENNAQGSLHSFSSMQAAILDLHRSILSADVSSRNLIRSLPE